jgi:hypothetical protein
MKTIILAILALALGSCANNHTKNDSKHSSGTKKIQQQNNTDEIDYPSYEYIKTNGITNFDKYFADKSKKDKYYSQALKLIENGERDKGINILQALVNNFPDFKQAASLLDILEAPFSTSAIVVERHIQNFLRAPSTIEKFDIAKPPTPQMPARPVLVRGEFETTATFNHRIAKAKQRYNTQAGKIVTEYKRNINIYNQAVKDYNKKILWEKKSRLEKVPSMRKRYMDIALSEILGKPQLTDLNYFADKQQFTGKLVASNNNLTVDVKVAVPLAKAQDFKQNPSIIKPLVKMEVLDDKVVFSQMEFDYNGDIYVGELLDKKSLLEFSKIKLGNTEVEADVDNNEVQQVEIEEFDFNPHTIEVENIVDFNNIDYNSEFIIDK